MTEAHSTVLELTDADYRARLSGGGLVFVDVYASWCGPCRLFSPLFDKVAARHPKAKFFKIDGDLNPGSRSDLTIDNLPYVVVYRDGALVQGLSVATEEGFEELVVKCGG